MLITPSRTRAAILLTGVVSAWVAVTDVVATPDAQRRPTFEKDIAPIIYAHCTSCHRPGQAAPFSMLSYDDVRDKGPDIVKATESHRMPPWRATQGPGFPALLDDRRLTDRQITTLKTWVTNGVRPGDVRRAPPPPSFPSPWPLGLPDLTMTLPRTIAIPAGVSDEYRNVVFELSFPADLWISGIDYLPAERSILRHARFFAAPPDLVVADTDVLPGIGGLLGAGSLENYGDQLLTAASSLIDLGGWVPGLARRLLPNDLAIRVPARSVLVVQMHMRPSEVDAVEDGRLAIYFSKPMARRAIQPLAIPPAFGIAAGLAIPAGDPHFVVNDSFTLPVDVDAVGARGHAQYLGREMTLTATPPAGPARGLLRIGQWDVDWPDTYFFVAPVRLPRGTTIQAEIVYDNSAANPRNIFSPPRRVGWGRLSAGEMAGLTLLIAAPQGADADTLNAAIARHVRDQLLGKGR